ncbi:hypothetical protein GYMLUDRAFT_169437, partial [Collybiopsis luxurians FD-317 M1]
DYMHQYEPELVKQHLHRCLKHCCFWAAGINNMLCVDQYDKLKYLGLALHTGIDPMSGKLKWLKVWFTINSMQIYCSSCSLALCFIDIPLITQSDPRPKNFCLAKGHSYIRQSLDPNLQGLLQHRYMKDKNNIPPEIVWSNIRRNLTPGLENILANLQPHMDYSPQNSLQYNVFKWVVIPWFQRQLDDYVELCNSTKQQAQKNKILPHGPPDDIDEHPDSYGVLDFKVIIDPDASYIQEAEQLYAPPDHPIFDLVPAEFDYWANNYFQQIGSPEINHDTVWDVYVQMLQKFRNNSHLLTTLELHGFHNDRDDFVKEVQDALNVQIGNQIQDMELLLFDEEGLYIGGVQGGLGPDIDEDLADGVVQFSSDDANSENDSGSNN